ncbi:MAG: U32 family peptidase [Bacilli bacterium]|nr:U32 family peptidase [Bacilli bacterium]
MKKPELLAPAGNMESLKAAIEAGADAIYLGGYMFGARSFAGNFSNDEIKEAIIYAHLYGVKIYVTVNTLIYEDEVEIFINYIDFLYKANVDAIIVQDLGMLDLVRQMFPLLEIHASTQMHLHNLEGVKFVEELGVKRAVLARETDIDLIKEIKENTNIEIEIFVHGALCISYSGQCFMSSLIGGRSGNRGSCAGSCRQKYSLISDGKKVNKDKYLLSTKDLNTLEYLGELIDIGIESFKIEGRMKRPEYVYTVVKLYRKAIDQYCKNQKIEIDETEILELKKIFNREFTKGFLFHEKENNLMNQKRPNHIGIPIGKVVDYQKGIATIQLDSRLQNGDGIRILGSEDSGTIVTKICVSKKQVKEIEKGIVQIPYKETVKVGSIVLKTTDKRQLDEIDALLLKKNRKVAVSLELTLKCNKIPILKLSDGKNQVVVNGNKIVERALKAPISKERIQEQIEKFGDSIYQVKSILLKIDDNIFISIKELNELRREAILKLNKKRIYNYPYQKGEYHREVPNFPEEKKQSILINELFQYKLVEKEDWNFIYVEKEELFNMLKIDSRVIRKIPRVFHHISLQKNLSLIGEVGSFHYYPQVFIDWSFNVTNSYTAALLFNKGAKMVTLSYELDENRIKLLTSAYKNRYHAHPNFEIIIYGKEEVMISKFHLLEHFRVKNGYLKDRFGNLYPIEENKNFMKIYNYKPRNKKEDYYQYGINSVRLQFLDEKESEMKNIINEFWSKNKTIRRMDR